jgi:CubicO group peptidase (beta-lactamase class C family)
MSRAALGVAVVLLVHASHNPVRAQADSTLLRRVDSVLAPWRHDDTPGCALGVDRDGAPLLRRAVGMASLESGSPWTIGTISESGSVAKQFVAAGLVLLALDGKLSLDDDISRWIPEVRGIGRRITIRHLLTHTSGLPDRYLLHEVEGRAAGEVDHPNAEVMHVVSRLQDLNFDPGDDYLYSNTGYVVAVAVLERVSGRSLQQFTDDRIFRPLGMTSSRWREDHRVVVPGRAAAYSGVRARGFRNDHPFTRVFGSGGLLTTVDDFLKWQAALQRGAGGWGAVRDSLEVAGHLNDGTVLTYGLGVGVGTWRGVRVVSHTGSTGGYRAALFRYPERNVAIALLCNVGSANPAVMARHVAEAVLNGALAAADPAPQPAALEASRLAALAGVYHSPRTEEVMVLSVRDGQLFDGGTRLLPFAADSFRFSTGNATLVVPVQVPAGGAPSRLRIESPGARAAEYVRTAPPRLDSGRLASYAGWYRSPELGAAFQLAVERDTLRLLRSWRPSLALVPLYDDGFRLDGSNRLRFLRGADGRITGFVIWAGRVRHLRFDRQPAGEDSGASSR